MGQRSAQCLERSVKKQQVFWDDQDSVDRYIERLKNVHVQGQGKVFRTLMNVFNGTVEHARFRALAHKRNNK